MMGDSLGNSCSIKPAWRLVSSNLMDETIQQNQKDKTNKST